MALSTTIILWTFSCIHSVYGYFKGPQLFWTDAESWCNDKGTHLASFHSAEQWQHLLNTCNNTIECRADWSALNPGNDCSACCSCWIGLNDLHTEGSYQYTDGTTTDYGFIDNDPSLPTFGEDPWQEGEPSADEAASDHDCVHMWDGLGWIPNSTRVGLDDINCDYLYYTVCNDAPTTIPTVFPTTIPSQMPTTNPSLYTLQTTEREDIYTTTEAITIKSTIDHQSTFPQMTTTTISDLIATTIAIEHRYEMTSTIVSETHEETEIQQTLRAEEHDNSISPTQNQDQETEHDETSQNQIVNIIIAFLLVCCGIAFCVLGFLIILLWYRKYRNTRAKAKESINMIVAPTIGTAGTRVNGTRVNVTRVQSIDSALMTEGKTEQNSNYHTPNIGSDEFIIGSDDEVTVGANNNKMENNETPTDDSLDLSDINNYHTTNIGCDDSDDEVIAEINITPM